MGTANIEEAAQMVQWIAQKTYLESVLKNREVTEKWENYRKEHQELLPRLSEFCKNLKIDIMVPIGKKALMQGKLVHTNEILISLGDGWFIKQSADKAAEVCKRRIKKCDEFLEKLRKEHDLLESRMNFPILHHSIFPNEEIKEIIEPLDEEEEKEWRKKHKQSLLKSQTQEMTERREVEDKDSETTDAVWRRLEELELEEELAGELGRVGVTDEDIDEESSDLDSDDISDESIEVEKPVINKPIDDEAVKDSIIFHTTADKTTATPVENTAKKISKFKASRLKK